MYDDLIRSIEKACRILGKEFTERDIPTNPNAFKELTNIKDRLWKEIYAKTRR